MDSQSSNYSGLLSEGEYDALLSEELLNGQVRDFVNETDTGTYLAAPRTNTESDLCNSLNMPPPTGPLPSTEEFPGSFNFNFSLNQSTKAAWVYSQRLNQVFIEMGKLLTVEFRVGTEVQLPPGMRIRTLPVYTSIDDVSVPVKRCTVHTLEDDPSNQAHAFNKECHCCLFSLAGHIVRVQCPSAEYYYDQSSERHSVVVPFSGPTNVPFTFTCKNSCFGGIRRRPTQLIFTLETAFGDVVGRRVLVLKICSCPKRDKARREKEMAREELPLQKPTKRLTLTPVQVVDPKVRRQENFNELKRNLKLALQRLEDIARRD